MESKPISECTRMEAANSLARAFVILRRTEAEMRGFKLEEKVKEIILID